MPRPTCAGAASRCSGSTTQRVRARSRDPSRKAKRGEGPKKVAEPVAVSSTTPANFPLRPLAGLARTARRCCFVLLPRRARRKWESRGSASSDQGFDKRKTRNLRILNNQHFPSPVCNLWITPSASEPGGGSGRNSHSERRTDKQRCRSSDCRRQDHGHVGSLQVGGGRLRTRPGRLRQLDITPEVSSSTGVGRLRWFLQTRLRRQAQQGQQRRRGDDVPGSPATYQSRQGEDDECHQQEVADL